MDLPPAVGTGPTVETMTSKDDIREFLVSRRANVTPAQAGIPDFGGERRVPGCAARRSPSSPGSASTTTPAWSAATSAARPRACSTPSPAPCSSTTSNASHLFDLARPAPGQRPRGTEARAVGAHLGAARAGQHGRACDRMQLAAGPRGREPHGPRAVSPRTSKPTDRTSPGSSSSTPRARDYYVDWPLACSLTAAMLRSRPDATRSTGSSPRSSASSPSAARSSARTGPARTSTSTAPGSRSTATPWSARSRSRTTCSRCPASRACPSSPTAPKKARDRREVRAALHLGGDPGKHHPSQSGGRHPARRHRVGSTLNGIRTRATAVKVDIQPGACHVPGVPAAGTAPRVRGEATAIVKRLPVAWFSAAVRLRIAWSADHDHAAGGRRW